MFVKVTFPTIVKVAKENEKIIPFKSKGVEFIEKSRSKNIPICWIRGVKVPTFHNWCSNYYHSSDYSYYDDYDYSYANSYAYNKSKLRNKKKMHKKKAKKHGKLVDSKVNFVISN